MANPKPAWWPDYDKPAPKLHDPLKGKGPTIVGHDELTITRCVNFKEPMWAEHPKSRGALRPNKYYQ